MPYKQNFTTWLDENFPVNSGAKSSYISALEILSEIIGESIFEVNNISKLTSLYNDVLGNQKLKKGKYYNSTKALSFGKNGTFSAALKNYLKFLEETTEACAVAENTSDFNSKQNFDITAFQQKVQEAGLIISPQLVRRFVASLCTKPFVICSGLSGSGKTKLAQAFAQWICPKEEEKNKQYCIVPVGADWTNRTPLLGFPNALQDTQYVRPENGVLDLIIQANLHPSKPFFLILDEMNLSHVERYFADFLSAMESGDAIPLHNIENEENGIPKALNLPSNLFIIGTVNIDETTYMFSPKVLDRANTIEFRLNEQNISDFIDNPLPLKMDLLKGKGINMGKSFVELASKKTEKNLKNSKEDLIRFFNELKKSGAEFGYRTTSEIGRLMLVLKNLGESENALFDIAIMQKLLPKLHGSRTKLSKVLPVLGSFCLSKNFTKDQVKELYLDPFLKDEISESDLEKDDNIRYKISFEKICRMYKNVVENGFASYVDN